jgi:hypothetical protein
MLLLVCLSLGLLVACKKQSGLGGDASIHGRIAGKHYNATFTNLLAQDYLPDRYVYIIYGDDLSYGTRLKTNFDGYFEFKYLYKGSYTLYTYSLDSAAMAVGAVLPSDSAVKVNVEIVDRKESVDLGDLNVFY